MDYHQPLGRRCKGYGQIYRQTWYAKLHGKISIHIEGINSNKKL